MNTLFKTTSETNNSKKRELLFTFQSIIVIGLLAFTAIAFFFYNHLSIDELTDLVERLTHIHTGEMVAYYIQMYGFYEGHTGFRADPVCLAYIFGLKSLQELDQDFGGELYKVLTSHHVTIFE